MCAHEIINEGPLQRITGPFIIIFPALNPASVVYPISLGTPSVLPIDPKVLSDLFLVTVTHNMLKSFEFLSYKNFFYLAVLYLSEKWYSQNVH